MSDANLALAREKVGRMLKDRWVLENVIGVGGMAVVFSARHRNGARTAIKLLHGQLSEDPVVRERFLREAYLANSIEHDGVVRVLDDDADPQFGPFLVMELLEGESVLDLLERGVTFDIPRALDIADQALDVLANAHERGVVHRDLKPANLFLCRSGVVKVLDFGIARILDENSARLTRTGVPLGTPAYMAPEQARGLGRIADGRADIYALGATIFRILAGRHVHVGHGAEQIAKVATQRAPRLADVCKVPAWVSAVVDRALEFEPERRYQSAREMQSDIRALRNGVVPPIASRPPPPPGGVPALPPITPRRRPSGPRLQAASPERDPVTLLAESARERAHALARRPDAFTVQARPAAPPDDDDDEDDENMLTVAAPPRNLPLGPRPMAAVRPSAGTPATRPGSQQQSTLGAGQAPAPPPAAGRPATAPSPGQTGHAGPTPVPPPSQAASRPKPTTQVLSTSPMQPPASMPRPASGAPRFPAAPQVNAPPPASPSVLPRRAPSSEAPPSLGPSGSAPGSPLSGSSPGSKGSTRPSSGGGASGGGASGDNRQSYARAFANMPNVPVPQQPSRPPSGGSVPAPHSPVPPQGPPAATAPIEPASIPDSPTLTSYQAPSAFAAFPKDKSEGMVPPPSVPLDAEPGWIQATQKKVGREAAMRTSRPAPPFQAPPPPPPSMGSQPGAIASPSAMPIASASGLPIASGGPAPSAASMPAVQTPPASISQPLSVPGRSRSGTVAMIVVLVLVILALIFFLLVVTKTVSF